MTLVSVVTPTYDGAAFVAETVESVLAQTYEQVEHVLVDDGSTDGTPELLEEYAGRHPGRVRVLRRDERAGPCRRRNDALAAAKGDLVAWLDHDDVWAPDKLERQVAALHASPGTVLAFTQYEEFDDATERTLSRSALRGGPDLLERLFVEGCFVASSTVLFRRDAMDRRCPRLREAHPSFGDDYFLWLALLLDGEGVLVDAPLARLRRHAANESARLGRENYHLLRLALLEDYLDAYPEARSRLAPVAGAGLAGHAVAAASYELEHGRRARAGRLALRAARYDPRGATRVLGRTAVRAPRFAARRARAAVRGARSRFRSRPEPGPRSAPPSGTDP